MDPIEPTMRFCLKFLTVSAVLFDFFCFKWRGLANGIIYLELLTRIVAMMTPNYASYLKTEFDYIYMFACGFFGYYCD